jgi:hypothetical protein
MFDTSTVAEINPIVWTGNDAKLSWTPTTSGLTWQVYVDRAMVYHGTNTYCFFPWPPDDVQVEIGSVLPSEELTDFSADLPAAPSARAELFWKGGSYQDPAGGVAGFRVYGEHTPGGGVDYNTALADIPAYTGGIVTDGFGLNGFGDGGFGMAAADYSWTSAKLRSGTWKFAVKTYDLAGNEGAADTVTVDIRVPPEEPAPFPGTMERLHYRLSGWNQGGYGSCGFGNDCGFGLSCAILTWNASPE